MKNFAKVLLALLIVLTISGCGNKEASNDIEKLSIAFVPSRNPEEIISKTEPLGEMIKKSLSTRGFNVGEVEITVGTSYEAVGEAVAAGSVDVAFIPAGTFVLYEEDGADVLLSATRNGLNKTSKEPKDWNDGKATTESENQVSSYNSLIIAGPSEKGQELAKVVNSGGSLTFDQLNSATWCTSSPTSSAGYIYPSLWLEENFDKSIKSLSNQVQTASYADSLSRLGTETCDISVGFGDMRMDLSNDWAGPNDIWTDTNVIGISSPIMNDTITVSEHSDNMSSELRTALQESMVEIAGTQEGKEVIDVYSHTGYVVVTGEDYESERKAQESMK